MSPDPAKSSIQLREPEHQVLACGSCTLFHLRKQRRTFISEVWEAASAEPFHDPTGGDIHLSIPLIFGHSMLSSSHDVIYRKVIYMTSSRKPRNLWKIVQINLFSNIVASKKERLCPGSNPRPWAWSKTPWDWRSRPLDHHGPVKSM